MNRLHETLPRRRENAAGGLCKLLCPFLTAGYPSLAATPELLLTAQEALSGAGVIELGIPFSDPVADGPVIQASYTEALAKSATVDKCLGTVAAARQRGLTLPVVAMVSFSIIFKRGTREFAQLCRANDLDGVVLPDVPLEEAPGVVAAFHEAGLRTCLLVAPTTPSDRRAAIARLCDGFVYYLSVSGITQESEKSLPGRYIAPNILELSQSHKNTYLRRIWHFPLLSMSARGDTVARRCHRGKRAIRKLLRSGK